MRSGSSEGKCAWCGAGLANGERAGARRVRCPSCGAQTTFPVPDAAELDRAYGGHYRPSGGRFAGPGERLLRGLRGRPARRIDEIARPGPVLDVGAGEGVMLTALRSRGRNAFGTERGEDESGGAAAERVADRDWAAIVLWHSLEHLPEAGARLTELAGRLAPGGVIVVAMPNPASLQARAFGDRWLHLDLPRHLVHVPAPALLARLRDAGLRIERLSYLRGGQVVFGWLHGLVGLLPGHPHLYDAIRRPQARARQRSAPARALTLLAGAALLPVAIALAAIEAAARRGGTVYVEARRG